MAEEPQEEIVAETSEGGAVRESGAAREVSEVAEADAPVAESEEKEAPAEEIPLEEHPPEAQVADLEAALAEAEAKAAEYLDGWQRAQASLANYRKRVEADRQAMCLAANAALLTRLLPILDDFRRAFESIPEEFDEHPWVGGIRMVQRKLQQVIESENVKAIAVNMGDPFDPMIHHAVLHQPFEGFEEGQIVQEIERGYKLGDRILRPSMVVVAKAPPEAEEDSESSDEVTEEEVVDAEFMEMDEAEEDTSNVEGDSESSSKA